MVRTGHASRSRSSGQTHDHRGKGATTSLPWRSQLVESYRKDIARLVTMKMHCVMRTVESNLPMSVYVDL